MKAVDTNVLARLILQDDDRQAMLARDVVAVPVWVSLSVWVELGWVLHRRLGLDRAIVAEGLSVLLAMETVHVSDRAGLEWAIERYRAGADWADAIHLLAANGVADGFVTFDRALKGQLEAAPVPIETLA